MNDKIELLKNLDINGENINKLLMKRDDIISQIAKAEAYSEIYYGITELNFGSESVGEYIMDVVEHDKLLGQCFSVVIEEIKKSKNGAITEV